MTLDPDFTFLQVYLAQGFGLGIAIGIMYIPGVGIVSHYYQRRRALVIGLVTSVRTSLALLPADVQSRSSGICSRRGNSAHHTECLVSWFSWLSSGGQSQRWADRWTVGDRNFTDETEISREEEEDRENHQLIQKFLKRSALCHHGFRVRGLRVRLNLLRFIYAGL